MIKMADGMRAWMRTWELVDKGLIDLDRVLVLHSENVTVRDLIRRIEGTPDDQQDEIVARADV